MTSGEGMQAETDFGTRREIISVITEIEGKYLTVRNTAMACHVSQPSPQAHSPIALSELPTHLRHVFSS